MKKPSMSFSVSYNYLCGILQMFRSILKVGEQVGLPAFQPEMLTFSADAGQVSLRSHTGLFDLDFHLAQDKTEVKQAGVAYVSLGGLDKVFRSLRRPSRATQTDRIGVEHLAEGVVFSVQGQESTVGEGESSDATWPMIDVQRTHKASFLASSLQDGLHAVSAFCSKELSRKKLNGVLFEFDEKESLLVATDGAVLSEYSLGSSMRCLHPDRVILPRQSVFALEGLLKKTSEHRGIKVFCDTFSDEGCFRRIVTLQSYDWELTTHSYPLPFCDYKSVVPHNRPYTAGIERKPLLRALKGLPRVSRRSQYISLSLKEERATIRPLAEKESSDGAFSIPIEYKGPPLARSVCAMKLSSLIQCFPAEEVFLSFAKEITWPITIHRWDERPKPRMLLMPLYIGDQY